MKKRSNPIPLLSVALLCFGLIGYFNFRSQPAAPDQKPDPTPQQPAGAPPAMGQQRAAPSKKDMASNVDVGGPSSSSASTGKKMPPPPGPPGLGGRPGMGGPPGMGPGGKMRMPPKGFKPPKPMPSDSQISTQWYTDETNKTAGH